MPHLESLRRSRSVSLLPEPGERGNVMTMFDERERAFENLFVHEEGLRFLALARRNQLFARWAAEQMGLRGPQLNDYIRSFTTSAVRSEPNAPWWTACGLTSLRRGLICPSKALRQPCQQRRLRDCREFRVGPLR